MKSDILYDAWKDANVTADAAADAWYAHCKTVADANGLGHYRNAATRLIAANDPLWLRMNSTKIALQDARIALIDGKGW